MRAREEIQVIQREECDDILIKIMLSDTCYAKWLKYSWNFQKYAFSINILIETIFIFLYKIILHDFLIYFFNERLSKLKNFYC